MKYTPKLILVLLIWVQVVGGVSSVTSSVLSGNGTLVSSGEEVFEHGFFNLALGWYVGIWYKKIPERSYVWVANRNNPLPNSNGTLEMVDSKLVLRNESHKFWSSEENRRQVNEISTQVVAELLPNGNFVLRYSNSTDPERYIWESFNSPTDTLLPGMKLRSGQRLESWRNKNDPAKGEFAFELRGREFPRFLILRGEKVMYRNDARYGGLTDLHLALTITREDAFGVFQTTNNNNHYPSRLLLTSTGILQGFEWNQTWNHLWVVPTSMCDLYNSCKSNSYCNHTNTSAASSCSCIPGFEEAIQPRNNITTCLRKTKRSCYSNHFARLSNMKLPDSGSTFPLDGINSCADLCVDDCDCSAYSVFVYKNVTTSSDCTLWTGDLIDIGQYPSSAGQDLYVKLNEFGKKKSKTGLILGLSLGFPALLLVALSLFCYWQTKHKSIVRASSTEMVPIIIPRATADAIQTPSTMDFSTILEATNHFSHEIGHGGFGHVYKGTLPDGREIAVKRLSKESSQGPEEFYTEANSISRLRHMNIVRLYGWCVHEEEKLLVYEYLVNGSLERQLFFGGGELTWPMRFHIIKGVAHGLAYIEEGSNDLILHRDLKPANILLDRDMTPKISDFGLARMCARSQNQVFTEHMAGTYGYISPEYATDGIFSAQSDIFSYGVTVLEILSGKRNRQFKSHLGPTTNLLGYAWIQWKDKNYKEILDPRLVLESIPPQQFLRCLEAGLLCVQQHARDRPQMSVIVALLEDESLVIPRPKKPGFFNSEDHTETIETSANGCTGIISQVEPRRMDNLYGRRNRSPISYL